VFVRIRQLIGRKDRRRNDLDCVRWGVINSTPTQHYSSCISFWCCWSWCFMYSTEFIDWTFLC